MCYYDEKTQTLQDPWSVEDVQTLRPDLTEEQACEVLAIMASNFDAEIGINWFVMESTIDWLYSDEDEE